MDFIFNDTGTEREIFTAWYDDRRHSLVISGYLKKERETTRHKWKTKQKEDSVYTRDSDKKEMPLTDEIKVEIKRRFFSNMAVISYKERT